MRDRARTVVIGAGIVGVSAAYHLAELGERDVLVLDQGPLFETGGSTSHAPGLAFQTNGSRMMCRIAQESVALYGTLEREGEPAWYGVGGIEVATTEARMRELKRRLGFARSYGLEGAELLTPAGAAAKVPLLDPSTILGAYHVPSDGIAKGVRIAAALAGKAEEMGVAFDGGVAVTGFDIRDGRVNGVRTDRGDVECERVLLCAGIWGPSVGALAGVPVPLLAVQHQLVWTDPIPELEGDTREVAHPILRHQDMAMYFRHRQDHYAVGSYKHEPIATPQSDLRRPGEDPSMPSLMPFTPADFDVAEAEAARLLPVLKGHMRPADPDRSINGMFSFTPDAGSIVGESAAVRGVWICEAVWVAHAAGFGRHVAEWMIRGEPSIDLAEADANRFYPYMTTPPFVLERGKQQYREVYDIIHPRQQMARPRKLRLSPFYDRQVDLGAEFVVGAGWERPEWFEANAALVPSDAPWLRRDEWAARFWSPIEGAEHLATRSSSALFDLTPFAKFDVEGPDALAYLERICANRIDRPVGTIVYTAMLTPTGGIRCDLTITRKENELFRVITGGGSGQHDLAWMRRQIRAGELGWELYGQFAMGGRAWEVLWEAGRDRGLVAAGLGCFDTLRLEKGYRFWGQDIDTERDPFEAGLGFAVKMDTEGFRGREALERALEQGSRERLACITLDDPSAVVLGKEPIRSGGHVVGYATSAGYGYSVGRCIVYGYLHAELAAPGSPVEV